MLEVHKKITNLVFEFSISKSSDGSATYGSVRQRDILLELKKNGISLNNQQIEKFKPIRTLGEKKDKITTFEWCNFRN